MLIPTSLHTDLIIQRIVTKPSGPLLLLTSMGEVKSNPRRDLVLRATLDLSFHTLLVNSLFNWTSRCCLHEIKWTWRLVVRGLWRVVVLIYSGKPSRHVVASRQAPIVLTQCEINPFPRNINIYPPLFAFKMSKTVQIASPAQFNDLLKSSRIVVTDCMLPHYPHHRRQMCPSV